MSGAVVDDPEHPRGRAVGLLAHDLRDEAIEGSDAGLGFAATEDLGPMHIPGGQVGPGAPALVLVLDAHRPAGAGGGSGGSAADLNAGLFVRARGRSLGAQGRPSQRRSYRSRMRTGFGRKVGIAREDPASMPPRAEGILLSQRHTVAPLISATRPWEITAGALGREPRQRKPARVGSSQARALTATTTLGGKAGWTPASRLLLQARVSARAESLAPLADDLARRDRGGRR